MCKLDAHNVGFARIWSRLYEEAEVTLPFPTLRDNTCSHRHALCAQDLPILGFIFLILDQFLLAKEGAWNLNFHDLVVSQIISAVAKGQGAFTHMQIDPVIISERCNVAQLVKMRKVYCFSYDVAIVVTALKQIDFFLVIHYEH